MPGTGTLTLSGEIAGYSTGTREVTVLWPLPAAIDDATGVSLAIGDNQILVPGGASIVIIEPPEGNGQIISLKGQVGDVGINIHKTLPHLQSLDPTTTGFYLSITSVLPGPVQLTFF